MARHHSAASLHQAAGLAALVLILSTAWPTEVLAGQDAAGAATRRGRRSRDARARRVVTRGEVEALRDEIAELRAAVDHLRRELTTVRTAGPTAGPQPPPEAQPPAIPVEMLKTQVAEHAQTKVESSSRLPVKLSGTIQSTTFVNSGDANWLENPNLLGASRRVVHLTARQSRIGIAPATLSLGKWQAGGTIVFDFSGVCRVSDGHRHGAAAAALRVRTDRTHAPRFSSARITRSWLRAIRHHLRRLPSRSSSDRAISICASRRPDSSSACGEVRVAGGIVAPIAGDHAGLRFEAAGAVPANARRPALEGRAEFHAGDRDSGRRFTAGVATQYGWRHSVSNLTPSWAVAWTPTSRPAALARPVSSSSPIAPVRSARRSRRPRGRRAAGPRAGSRSRRAPGSPRDSAWIVRTSPAALCWRSPRTGAPSRNLIFDVTPEVAFSVEHRWLRTSYAVLPVRSTQHVNGVLAIRF